MSVEQIWICCFITDWMRWKLVYIVLNQANFSGEFCDSNHLHSILTICYPSVSYWDLDYMDLFHFFWVHCNYKLRNACSHSTLLLYFHSIVMITSFWIEILSSYSDSIIGHFLITLCYIWRRSQSMLETSCFLVLIWDTDVSYAQVCYPRCYFSIILSYSVGQSI